MKISYWKIFQSLPFALQCVWNPFLALDLTDDDGYPDHNKILPTLATGGIILCSFTGHPIGAVIAIGILAASFGLPMFKTFLETKSFTATATADLKEAVSISKVTTTVQNLIDAHKQDKGA